MSDGSFVFVFFDERTEWLFNAVEVIGEAEALSKPLGL